MRTNRYLLVSTFFFAIFMVFLNACAQQVSDKNYSSTMIPLEIAEESYIMPLRDKSKETGDCNTCSTKPGDITNFSEALKQSKVQRYTNAGTIKKEYKEAETFCDLDFFSTCNNRLIITSTGEAKDRLELRQEKDLALNQKSIMRFQATWENLPSSNLKKGVTFAQIHSDASTVERPLLRIEYTGANEIRCVVTDTYEKGEGSAKNDLLFTYKEGQELYGKIELTGIDNQVLIYLKNLSTGKSATKTYRVSNKWLEKDGDFYFKTGAYLQEDGGRPQASYSLLAFY